MIRLADAIAVVTFQRAREGEPNYKNAEALGRSRGGLTSKIHLLADARCGPLARVTNAGQRHD